MKNVFVYGLPFFIVFLGITALLILGQQKYRNIFVFDFSHHPDTTQVKSDSLNLQPKQDSLKVVHTDSLTQEEKPLVEALPIKNENKEAEQPTLEKPKTEPVAVQTPMANLAKDSSYQAWKKETIKIYEAMDTKKVAKIISSLSDNVARDLLYSMKKKKAADVLSQLPPEVAIKLTRQ